MAHRRFSKLTLAFTAFASFAWLILPAYVRVIAIASEGDPLAPLEARYQKATTLQANFLERYSENGTQVRVEAGKAYFLRPGRMRWEYEKPEKSVFLVDGKYVWFYVPDDHTATRMPAKKSDDWRTPIAFLTTGMKLARRSLPLRSASGGGRERQRGAESAVRDFSAERTGAHRNSPGSGGAD
jgi:chaperone LolA